MSWRLFYWCTVPVCYTWRVGKSRFAFLFCRFPFLFFLCLGLQKLRNCDSPEYIMHIVAYALNECYVVTYNIAAFSRSICYFFWWLLLFVCNNVNVLSGWLVLPLHDSHLFRCAVLCDFSFWSILVFMFCFAKIFCGNQVFSDSSLFCCV